MKDKVKKKNQMYLFQLKKTTHDMTRNNSVTKHLLEGKEHHTEITLKNKAESTAEIGN